MSTKKVKLDAALKVVVADDLLTPKEFAEAYKISLSWLAKARKRGAGPTFESFGRSIRYHRLKIPE
jgi:hypothetical protein